MKGEARILPDANTLGRLTGSVLLIEPHLDVAKTFQFEVIGFDIFRPSTMKPSWLFRDGNRFLFGTDTNLAPKPNDSSFSQEQKILYQVLTLGMQRGLDAFMGLLELMKFDGKPIATSEQLDPEHASWLTLGIIESKDEFEIKLDVVAANCDKIKFLALLR